LSSKDRRRKLIRRLLVEKSLCYNLDRYIKRKMRDNKVDEIKFWRKLIKEIGEEKFNE
jgi:hypothetical protein